MGITQYKVIILKYISAGLIEHVIVQWCKSKVFF